MPGGKPSPEAVIRREWERWSGRPGGKRLFSILLGRLVPYTGTVRPRVEELRPGYARVWMRDRRGVRQHLGSVHAIALANLAEVATGLAFNYALPADARSILKGISIEYHKKARGRVTAEANAPLLEDNQEREIEMETSLRDEAGDVVATARARWMVGPRR
jgi:acyl-coenzyme A thioesterase PaaI-like protein